MIINHLLIKRQYAKMLNRHVQRFPRNPSFPKLYYIFVFFWEFSEINTQRLPLIPSSRLCLHEKFLTRIFTPMFLFCFRPQMQNKTRKIGKINKQTSEKNTFHELFYYSKCVMWQWFYKYLRRLPKDKVMKSKLAGALGPHNEKKRQPCRLYSTYIPPHFTPSFFYFSLPSGKITDSRPNSVHSFIFFSLFFAGRFNFFPPFLFFINFYFNNPPPPFPVSLLNRLFYKVLAGAFLRRWLCLPPFQPLASVLSPRDCIGLGKKF